MWYLVTTIFVIFDAFFTFTAVLTSVAVLRISKKLSEHPTLVQNETLILCHLSIYATFILLFAISMVIYLLSITNDTDYLDSWWYICTSINNIDNAINMLFIVYMTKRMTDRFTKPIEIK